MDNTAQDCAKILNISPQQQQQLQDYVDLLRQWQPRLNLVSHNTLPDIWTRHILDSGQIAKLLPITSTTLILDIGSGAGFPGMVLGVITDACLVLVESDLRKTIFLQEVARVLFPKQHILPTPKIQILNQRIEKTSFLAADIITARAVASLDQLFEWAIPQWHKNTKAIFFKGKNFQHEVDVAMKRWLFDYELVQSVASDDSKILLINFLKRK